MKRDLLTRPFDSVLVCTSSLQPASMYKKIPTFKTPACPWWFGFTLSSKDLLSCSNPIIVWVKFVVKYALCSVHLTSAGSQQLRFDSQGQPLNRCLLVPSRGRIMLKMSTRHSPTREEIPVHALLKIPSDWLTSCAPCFWLVDSDLPWLSPYLSCIWLINFLSSLHLIGWF